MMEIRISFRLRQISHIVGKDMAMGSSQSAGHLLKGEGSLSKPSKHLVSTPFIAPN
jgi:hypothetical protein